MAWRTRIQVNAASSATPTKAAVRHSLLQRKCACGGSSGLEGECSACRDKRQPLQRYARDQSENTYVPPIVHEVLRSSGHALDPTTRTFMETRFGHDFGRVQVHTDAKAAQSAQAVQALAYTVGQHIVFGAGQYSPRTGAGRFLLAHELSHVLQQGVESAHPPDQIRIGHPQTTQEREAEGLAAAVTHEQRGSPSPLASDSASLQLQRAGFGELRVAEARMAEEERIASGCPVKDTGTLSEVSWGETSGLYPTKDNLYEPEKWDRPKTCDLLRARAAVRVVGQRNPQVHKGTPGPGAIEQRLKPYHFVENFLALDPEIADAGVKWFFLSPQSDKPDVHPATTGTKRVKTYGSFYNVGGGDVAKGNVYIHFYKLST